MSESTIDVLLAFADDEHLMGQHHTEWIGVAPFLEEDLALSSIGQDELGHAVLLYEQVLALRGVAPTDLAIDQLAYRRADHDYRSCAFVEFTTTNWAEALVRHWIYDTVEGSRWLLFAESTNQSLRHIAASAQREEEYHRLHANALLDTLLADADAETRLQGALDLLLPLIPSLLTPTDGEPDASAAGTVSGSIADLSNELQAAISQRFNRSVVIPQEPAPADRKVRSASYAPLMQRMREVLDYDPDAVW